jgi:hypothetical protein
MGDWMRSYHEQLVELLKPQKRLPSYSTLRRALLHIDVEQYTACLAKFFEIKPECGETIALDGKLRGSYLIEDDNPNLTSSNHVSKCLYCGAGLILEPFEVDAKTNEIKALPALIQN